MRHYHWPLARAVRYLDRTPWAFVVAAVLVAVGVFGLVMVMLVRG